MRLAPIVPLLHTVLPPSQPIAVSTTLSPEQIKVFGDAEMVGAVGLPIEMVCAIEAALTQVPILQTAV